MKKTILTIAAMLSFAAAQSQEISDALHYAQENLNGTARFRAMSGAFGALGGDFSALNVNPAGSTVFSNSQLAVTLSNYNRSNKSNYFGTNTSQNFNSFDVNQAGAVLVLNNPYKSKWSKFAVAINYETANNFDNSDYFAGTNPTNSVAGYFQYYANQSGLTAADFENFSFESLTLRERQAFLGLDAAVIAPDPSNPNGNIYVSNVPAGGNYYQDNFIETAGYNGKLSFNASASYNDRLYFGLNLNTYFTDYTEVTSFYESNSNVPLSGPSVRNITFDNSTHTFGNGFSFQLGAIAKITPALRAGIAYESPTWYDLTDEVLQNVYTNGSNLPNGNYDFSNTDVLIVYDPYKLKTPGKFTGSLAYIFGKSGLLSVDYAIKDYSNLRFRPADSYFGPLNSEASNVLDTAAELRIGGEYRIKGWSLRAGYRFEESPYKNASVMGDLTSFSGGFGYNFTRTRIDLSYTHSQRDAQQSIFSHGLTDAVKTNTQFNNISLGLTFEL